MPEISKLQLQSSDGTSTPRTSSCECTPRSSNLSELDEPSFNNLDECTESADRIEEGGMKQSNINGSKSNEGNGAESKSADHRDENSSKEISRRLVEYFVVVSSVPKIRKQKDTDKQNEGSLQKQPNQSSQMAARRDARKAHLVTSEEAVSPPSPIHISIESLLGEPYPAEKKSIASLQETDKILGESMFGESPSGEKPTKTPKKKNNFFKSFQDSTAKMNATGLQNLEKTLAGMKSIHDNTAKMNAAGKQNLEKTLEGMNLDKTLAKFKSMKLLTPMASSVKDERGNQQVKDAVENAEAAVLQHQSGQYYGDYQSSSSSDSSFSENGVKPSNVERTTSEGSTFQPSQNPTSARKTSPVPLSPSEPPPPPPTALVSPLKPRIAPLTDRPITPVGASDNIRIGHDQDCGNREYNDDIDDCVLEPVITAQYPPVDHPDQPLNPMLPQFCHPQGTDVIVPLHEYKMPTVHHFVLTDSAGGKMYGTCLTVYEEFSPELDNIEITSGEDDDIDHTTEEGQERGYIELSMNGSPKIGRSRRRSKDHKYYAPRVLCLLSTWPYLSAFRTYLTQLYRLATTTNLMTAPLERYILNICAEVPAPPPGSFEVKISILDSTIRFWAPPADQPIPYVSLPYGVLFECLDIGNVLFVWYTLACERKVLLVSGQMSLLSVCGEILCSMLFPMRWSHLYIPCLPRFLTPMLDAPMPYLCGINREVFPHAIGDISDETVVVDLDRNVITMGANTPDLPFIPHRRKLKLEAALEKNAGDIFWKARGLTKTKIEQARLSGNENLLAELFGTADAVWDEKISTMDDAFNLAHAPDSVALLYSGDETGVSEKQSRWDAVQEAFLRFYASMLKDYRKYMPLMPTDAQSSWHGPGSVDDGRFLAEEFVQSQLPDFKPFLEELSGTQMFDDFVTRRMYNAGDAPDIKFFDQSIDAKRNRSKLQLKKRDTPFLHSAMARRDLKQIDAIQPNKANLPHRSRFDGRFDFKKGLYTYPTWPESFDVSLFGVPRPIPNIITAEYDRRSELTAMLRARHGFADEGRLPGSNNPSPEATAFVLFFVAFTEVIGKEWTLLEKQQLNMLDQYPDGEASIDPPTPERQWPASFDSLHSDFRPKQDQPEEVVEDDVDGPSNGFCAPDCTDFCNDVGKAIDPSAFFGWPRDECCAPAESDVPEYVKSPSQEERELEVEKARAIAKAQIDLGFNTLKMMRLRKLPTESITYKTLIESCGRCGIAHRAQQLLEMMQQDGQTLDSEVYFAYIKAFSNAESEITAPLSNKAADTSSEFSAVPSVTSSTVSFLNSSQGGESEHSKKQQSRRSSSTNKFVDGFQNAVSSTIAANRRAFKNAKSKRLRRLSKQKLTKMDNLSVTRAIKTHLELGYCILEDLYPGIMIDTDSDACPKCSCVLGQDDIIRGWKPCQVKDFSTACPSCKHRFVPKFSVSCNVESFEGSQGKGTPLYCDYLSPWVLLREIRSIITPSASGKAAKLLGVANNYQVGIDGIIDPKFREGSGINATLWWNMIVTFGRFKIPFTFLLQGSYENQQLIMPSLEDNTLD